VAQVGRISGPLLQANLERNGIDLAFRNDLNTTQLLYIDVNNGRVGVNTSAPSYDLDNASTTRTVDLIGDFANLAGYTVSDSTLSTIGNLFLNASEAVVMANMENGTIRISDNIISTIESNADVDVTPHGTGTTEILSDLNVFGDIYTPGNITFDGTITFGDADTDNVTFESDISSDIIPDANNAYSLGTADKRWNTLYTNFVNGQSVEVDAYNLGGVDLLFRNGGVIYVAQEGDDAHSGDHIFDPLATISEALSRAEASGEQPFTILIAPGEYQEALPLVVPPNVSVIGADIRNVVITPDTSSQSQDVFHLDEKTLIANLTIKNHYYDSINNTGYAFRFAPNAVLSERSPYIQNITVLTQETSQGAGDAGRGAWIDGDELNAATINKTMLFHSCTFISPGADVINMTNDVRVEWLNSFTYYANRGLYAFAGVSGGAELRSIGSANVYGTYGAVADGADTLMYLIQHNFGYIGAGNKNDNNEADVIQVNEVVELNSGQIHYVSTDQKGNFRVGDNFFVDLETGNSSITIDTGVIDSLSGLNINSPGGTTIISGSDIQTGNIIIADNDISAPAGDLNLEGATGVININSDTNVFGSLDIRDNFTFGGTLNIAGNQPGRTTASDKLTFNVDFQQDFKPHVTLTHSLGEDIRPWNTAWLDRAEIDDITIDENYITTDISNANLDLRSTNRIYVPSNNVQINNNLTVNGTYDMRSIDVSGTVNYVGNRTQTGDYNIAGEISNGNILIEDNFVTTTESNSNLELRSTKDIYVSGTNVQIDNNLSVSGITDLQNTIITGTLTQVGDRTQTGDYTIAGEISNSNILIEDNFVTTTDSNSDLELRSTKEIYVSGTNAQLDNNLTVGRITDLQNTIITGTLTQVGSRTQTGDYVLTNFNVDGKVDISSQVQLEEILVDGNVITTTTTNTDLELRANGTGRIVVPTENVQINTNLSADNIFNNNNVNITLQTEFVSADVSDITITQNYITPTALDQNLLLRANGTGVVNIEDSASFNQDVTVNTKTFLQDGTTTYEYGPELVVNGTFDTNLNGWAQAGGGSATDVNGNLQIDATGAARNVSQEITVEAGKTYEFKAQFRSVSNGNPFYLRIFESGIGTLAEWNETTGLTPNQELIFGFTAQTTAIDIIFRAVDTIVEWDNVSMYEDIGFVTTFTPVDVDVTDITQTGNTTQIGNIIQTGDTTVSGNLSVSNEFTKTNININDNVIQNTGEGLRIAIETNDNSSIPRIVQAIAAGSTADDYIDQTDKNLINFLIDNNYADVNNNGSVTTSDYLAYLQYLANGTSGDATIDSFINRILEEIIIAEYATPGYFNSILFNGDYFNPDLELRAAGTGNVVFSNPTVNITNNLLVSGTLSADSIVAPVNANISSNNFVISNTTKLDDNFVSTIVSNANLELRAFENKLVYVPNNDVTLEQDLTVNGNTDIDNVDITGNITQTGNRTQLGNMNVVGTVTVSTSNIQDNLQLDDVLIDRNIIESQDSNANLELVAQGAGIIEMPGNNVQVDTNLSSNNITTSNININNNFSFEDFELSSNVTLFDNVITTTESNSNLELRTIDSSNIELQNILINSSTISSRTDDINIESNSLVNITSSNALIIPTGDTSERQIINSSIRFNTTDNIFEGYNNNSKVISFNGVYSSNRRTSVLADSDSINFINNNSSTGSVNSTGILIHGLEVDDITIQNNNIRTSLSNSDLELRANGTGNLIIDDIEISSNLIINNSGGALVIGNTLYGNTQFVGPAVKLPSGTTAEQPVAPEVGTTRWNTDNDILEVWDGSTFITSAGTTATISQDEMDDLILEYTLIFG
jgi:hypothetical protein